MGTEITSYDAGGSVLWSPTFGPDNCSRQAVTQLLCAGKAICTGPGMEQHPVKGASVCYDRRWKCLLCVRYEGIRGIWHGADATRLCYFSDYETKYRARRAPQTGSFSSDSRNAKLWACIKSKSLRVGRRSLFQWGLQVALMDKAKGSWVDFSSSVHTHHQHIQF